MNDRYKVEICATLLVDKPPKLPLREEVMSLGFEIIYNADRLGESVAVIEAEKAVARFRREEEYREAKKIRLFPRSAKRIKQKEEIRRKKEDELKAPHAFSYESYEHELYSHSVSSSESADDDDDDNDVVDKVLQSKTEESNTSMKSNRFRAIVRARRMKSFGWLKKNHSIDETKEGLAGVKMKPLQHNESPEDVFAKAGFRDILVSVRSQETEATYQSRTAHDTELTSAHSGFLSTHGSTAPSNANTTISTRLGDAIQNMEIQFVASNVADKYLPELNTVQELNDVDADRDIDAAKGNASNGLNDDAKNAFANLGPVKDAFADLKPASGLYGAPSDSGTMAEQKEVVRESNSSSNAWLSSALNYYKDKASPVKTNDSKGVKQHAKKTSATKGQAHDGDEAGFVRSANGDESFTTFLDALTDMSTTVNQLEEMLTNDPGLLQVKQHDLGRFPLHILCQRPMPDRHDESIESLTDHLVSDIAAFKGLIELVVGFFPEACKHSDKKGDLPVHLAARMLMEWEAVWYEAVYGEAATENDANGKTTVAISKLYQSMSECIEIVLQPICATPELCREPGSVGEVLPLHIASIFTSTVRTLRITLESYPQAAGIACQLGGLTTFVPDNFLALQLHEELSTDFPKWEIETNAETDPSIKWSRSHACPQNDTQNCIKRSDLIFAYYPHIEPTRFEKARIRNLEALVHFEASQLASGKVTGMSHASQRLWRWMCIFTEGDSGRATYVNSVQRVLDGLPLVSVKYLASMKTAAGEQLFKEAATDCSTLIRRRLRELEATTIATRHTYNYRSWDETHWGRLFQHMKGQVAQLCRMLFNIEAGPFPTTFVVLPYELSQNADGSLGMADPAAVKIAVKFAECLLQLTEPASLLYFLNEKSLKYYDQSIFESPILNQIDELEKPRARIEEYRDSLTNLFGSQDKAYLYLIDEATGTPVLPLSDSTQPAAYPIVLEEPGSIVQKLFSFMLVGMSLMRGGRTISSLIEVLLDDNVTVLPQTWLDAAAELIGSLDEDAMDVETAKVAMDLKDDLSTFTSNATRRLKRAAKHNEESLEWKDERSILKSLLEMHDQQYTFAGLSAKSNKASELLWSRAETSTGRHVGRSYSMLDTSIDLEKNDDLSQLGGSASLNSTRSFDIDERDNASFPEMLLDVEGQLGSDTAGERMQMRTGVAGWFAKVAQNLKAEVESPVQLRRRASVDSGSRSAERRGIATSTRSRSEDSHKRRQRPFNESNKQLNEANQQADVSGCVTKRKGKRSQSPTRSNTPKRHTSPKKGTKKFNHTHTSNLLQDRNWANAPVSRHPAKKPDLSEVSKKFAELTKKHDDMSHEYQSKPFGDPIEEVHEERQPDNEYEHRYDASEPYIIDLTSMRTPSIVERAENSTSTEELILLQSDAHTGSEMTSWDGSRAEELLSRTRTLVAKANRRSDETFWGRRQEKEFRHKHSMLFDEFAFNATFNNDANFKQSARAGSPKMSTFESTRIWHDLTNQLDTNTYIEDHQILMLKVELAEEAKKMAKISKQVDEVSRQEMIIDERQSELLGKPSIAEDQDAYDSATSLSRSRRLLIRLCDLEDRILCDDIDIQHLSLEVLSIDLQLDEIQAKSNNVPSSSTAPKASFIPPNEIRIHAAAEDVRKVQSQLSRGQEKEKLNGRGSRATKARLRSAS